MLNTALRSTTSERIHTTGGTTTTVPRPVVTRPVSPAPKQTPPVPVRRRRTPNAETKLVTMSIPITIVVCALLVVYLAAYAHVTMLGIDQSQARVELRHARLENETLRAQLANLQSPDRVTKNAAALGMTRDVRHVDYIKTAPAAPSNSAQ